MRNRDSFSSPLNLLATRLSASCTCWKSMVSLIWCSWSHTESWGEGMDSAVALSALRAADVEVLASWADDEIFCAHAGWVASRSSVRDF